MAGASSAGEIVGETLLEGSLVVAAIRFASTTVRVESIALASARDSLTAGAALAARLAGPELAHVFVLADGTQVNGTELVRGFRNELPRTTGITGGLAGDADRFQRTLIVADGKAQPGHVVAVGFYGPRLRVGYGSMGGWDRHGAPRRITRAEGNVLYEIDGRPALAVYKELLGEKAAGLPATGLLYPLLIHTLEGDVVRTLLAIDEAQQSLTFAGDIPPTGQAYFMRAHFDRLIEGARGAALDSRTAAARDGPRLAILISCVGRKLVLQERTREELSAVAEALEHPEAQVGFYSYGEICPTAPGAHCTLHNQTMTITTFSEG